MFYLLNYGGIWYPLQELNSYLNIRSVASYPLDQVDIWWAVNLGPYGTSNFYKQYLFATRLLLVPHAGLEPTTRAF